MAKIGYLKLGKDEYKVKLVVSGYQNNNGTAVYTVDATTGEMFCTLSVNLPETIFLPNGVWYGKHWSENEGFLESLVKQGVIEEVTGMPVASSGFVSGIRAYKVI